MNLLRITSALKTRKQFVAVILGAAAVFFGAIAFVVSCRTTALSDMNTGTGQALAVKTVKAVLTDYCEQLESFGTISFKTKTDITSLVDGNAVLFFVKEGDCVAHGQIMGVMRNIQLENQRDSAKNAVDAAYSALEVAQNKLWDMEIAVKHKFFAIDKIDIQIANKNAALAVLKKNLTNAGELLAIDGITVEAYKNAEYQYNAGCAELNILKIELESANLGMLKTDLIAAGITPSKDERILKEQIMSLNTRSIRAEISASQASLKNAQNALAQLDALVAELTFKAPAAGIVGAKYFETGEYIKQNEKVFTIIDTQEVYAVFSIQESDIINFSIGSPLEIHIDSLGQNAVAKIDEISPMADSQSGNFQVKALIGNPDNAIKPGMFVECTLEKTLHEELVAMPESAVVKNGKSGDETDAAVFCVAGHTAVKKSIKIRAKKNGIIWAASGLDSGEIIIDNPSPFLKEGSSVTSL
ncbi:MAG: efflux RND transporter periplasmic adaptor subunit [Treponemataceae bacterium]|nr:MAG: efflux RND transporter periplasmic adaptor subunit [Treponemataceae bacterium]